jgi:hypothetical protein
MDRFDIMFKLLTDLDEKTDTISESQIRVEADIKHHIRRTDLLEKEIGRKFTQPTIKQIAAFFAIAGSIIGIAAGLGYI